MVLGLVLAYALSPIDLIPDFIPVLGYLDDLIIVPLGIALAVKLIPKEAMEDARLQAAQSAEQARPASRVGAILIVLIWLVVLAGVVWFILKAIS